MGKAQIISKFVQKTDFKETSDIIVPTINLECKTENEFTQRMLLFVGGPHVKLAIIQQPDRHTAEEIAVEKQLTESIGGVLKIPSLVAPPGIPDINSQPYIIIFTHENKLFMHPYASDAFSDIYMEDKRQNEL